MAAVRGGAGVGGVAAGAAAPPVRFPPIEAARASSPPAGDDRLGRYLLELWGKCRQSEDATVCRAELERTLVEVVGLQGQARVMAQLCPGSAGQSEPPGSLDFLSYWQGMDRFFATMQQRWPDEGDHSVSADTVRGLKRFRDGLLDHWRGQGATGLGGSIAPAQLLAMLGAIQAGARDQQYWRVNMAAIADLEGDARGVQPCDLADAIHCWLGEIVEGASCGQEHDRAPLDAPTPSAATPLATPLATPAPASEAGSSRPRRFSASSDRAEGMASKELQRAYEVIESLRDLTDTRNSRAHRALEELARLQGSLGRQLHAQEAEIGRLRESGEALRRKRQDLEAELLRQVEVAEGHSDAAAEADAQRRRASVLERELAGLREHHAESCQEVQRLRAQVAESERQHADVRRRESVWGRRYEQLEQETERTDGHRQWMQAELSRQGAQLASAEEMVRQLRGESARLRASLEAAVRATRSASAYAAEEGESAACLRALLEAAAAAPAATAAAAEPTAAAAAAAPRATHGAEGAAAAAAEAALLAGVGASGGAPQRAVEEQTRMLRALVEELGALRGERDRLAEIPAPGARVRPTFPADEQQLEDEELTPRRRQAERRCDFLGLQVQALLRHTQQVEQLLDGLRDDRLAPGAAPEAQRRSSVVDMHKRATVEFHELDTSLHTIEVQKADVDRELERLRRRGAEQAEQLAATQRHRDELLQEVASLQKAWAPLPRPSCATSSTRSEHLDLGADARSVGQHSAHDDGGFMFGLDARRPTVITRERLEKQKRREAREKEKARARVQGFLLEGATSAPKARDHERHGRDKESHREEGAAASRPRDRGERDRDRDRRERGGAAGPHGEAQRPPRERHRLVEPHAEAKADAVGTWSSFV